MKRTLRRNEATRLDFNTDQNNNKPIPNRGSERKMATAVYGSISQFACDAESFTEWIERLEQWFIANDITAAGKRRVLFLSHNRIARIQAGAQFIAERANNKILCRTEEAYDGALASEA